MNKQIIEVADMEKITLKLDGLGCASCASKIETRSKNIQGVSNLTLDFSRSKLTFEHEGDTSEALIDEISRIVSALEPDVKISRQNSASFQVDRHSHSDAHHSIAHGHDFRALIRLGLSLLFFAIGLIIKDEPVIHLGALFVAYVLSGHKVLMRSYRNIRRGEVFDENFLMSIATFGAIAIGEYPEAVAVMIFYEIGEYFQDLAVNRSKHAISSLLDIRPDSATLLRDDAWVTVSPEEVKVGDLIMVKPGERIPLDGVIIDGGSDLDTSALTGESIPAYFENGDRVLSGSVVLNGSIKVKVASIYAESTVARILELVENATAHKAPTENFITKFARYYTPVVVAFAAGLVILPTLIFGVDTFDVWLYRGLVFLVISCPCALVVSVPLGFFSGIGNASRHGILVKGSNYLEALQEIDTIIFDKTGTLTEGTFEVFKTHLAGDQLNDAFLLKLAALAESQSNHPVAKSIVSHAAQKIHPDEILSDQEISGHGVLVKTGLGEIAAGNAKLMSRLNIAVPTIDSPYTHIYIALDARFVGAFDIRDKVKHDAKKTIDYVKQLGLNVLMLTGDRKAAAESIGLELGIGEVYSELLPTDKYDIMNARIKSGERVAFVGDGINDAPVLAGATVGISMGALGSDAAIEASDVVLMTDEPYKIVQAIKISRKTKQIVTQNIVFALGTKLLIMALGTIGLSSMWMAIFADVGVALIAVLNATRALTYKV
jgi:Cd2+/Zn2+-exporting ATPase